MKRASVATPVGDTVKQIRKYRDGAKKIFDKIAYKNWPIEVIWLIGKPRPEFYDANGTGPAGVAASLKTVDARIVFYDELLTDAEKSIC